MKYIEALQIDLRNNTELDDGFVIDIDVYDDDINDKYHFAYDSYYLDDLSSSNIDDNYANGGNIQLLHSECFKVLKAFLNRTAKEIKYNEYLLNGKITIDGVKYNYRVALNY